MSYLLDTCILSKLRKIKVESDNQLKSWVISHPENFYYISVLSIGEIQAGISKLNAKNKGANKKIMALEDWFLNDLIPRFKDRVLDIDAYTASLWGIMKGKAQNQNHTLPVIDSLIAATALQHNLILVTENTKDFIHTGVKFINPCQSL